MATSLFAWVWLVTAPVLLLPWVCVKFTVWIFLWAIILTGRTVLAMYSLRFVPVILLLIWAVGAPLQESQETFLEVGQTITTCTDFLWNSGVKLVLQDLIWCMRPLCDLYNLICETFIIIFRLLFIELGSLIDDIFAKKRQEREERFIFNGLPADTPPPAFGIIEDICDIINIFIDVVKDVVILIIGTVNSVLQEFFANPGNVFELFGELLNTLFTNLLGIPCLEFSNGISGFAESLAACSGLDALADCAAELNFIDYQNCVAALKKRRRSISDEGGDDERGQGYTTRDIESSTQQEKVKFTVAQAWERLADHIGKRWLNSTILPFAREKEERSRMRYSVVYTVGQDSPPVYRTPQGATNAQTMWIGLATVIRNLIIVFSSTHLDDETYRVVSMPYREKLKALRAMQTDLALKDFLSSFRGYAKEKADSQPTPIVVANLHTVVSAVVTRLLAPHTLYDKLEEFKQKGPEYTAAVKNVVLRMQSLEVDHTRSQLIFSGHLQRRAVYTFLPVTEDDNSSSSLVGRAILGKEKKKRKSCNVLRGSIWDITDYLEYAGNADPENYIRQEMDELAQTWTFDHTNVTKWKERKLRETEMDQALGGSEYYYMLPPTTEEEEGAQSLRSTRSKSNTRSTTASGPQTRIPVAAILLPLIKNPKFIVAAIVPFLTSAPGQVVIRRYFSLLAPIFGQYFASGLTDMSVADLLDLAENFVDVTIDNLFYLINVFLQFIFCSYWGFILKGAAFILSFIPVIGFIFSTAANWAVVAAAIMIGNCPPDPLLDDDGAPTQTPLRYISDILTCWETSVACANEHDCDGGAACRCPNSTIQWHTFFWSIGPSSTTNDLGQCNGVGTTGYCLCWPRIPCGEDTPFLGSLGNFSNFFDPDGQVAESFGSDSPLLPNFGLSSLFDVDCAKEYGYETNRIVWYKEPSLILLMWYNVKNSYLGIRYFVRDWIFSFPVLNAFLYTALMVIPIMLLIFGNMRIAFIAASIITAIVFGMPALSMLTERYLVPFFVRTENSVFFLTPIWRLILDWMRFSNHSASNPLGSPGNGEFFCAILNSPAIFGGAGIFVTLFIVIYYFFFISIFLGILRFLFYFFSAPFRVFWNLGACYVFYSDSYDIYVSRRAGLYIDAQFPSSGAEMDNGHPLKGQEEEGSHHFSPTKIYISIEKGFESIKKELSPPTFGDVWNSVWEPLLRSPQAHLMRTARPTTRIEEIPMRRKNN